MTATVRSSPTLVALGWRARRPWVRRRLRAALIAAGQNIWLSPLQLAHAAGIDDIPPAEAEAAVTDLVQAGRAEGIRGPRGWSHIRGLPAAAARPQPHAGVDSTDGDASTVRRPRDRGRLPAGDTTRWAVAAANGDDELVTRRSMPVSSRPFSSARRLPVRGDARLLPGLALFGAAALLALLVTGLLVRSWRDSGGDGPALTRAQWYQRAAHVYIDGYLAGRPGFALPYRFHEVTSVRQDAGRTALEEGMTRYIQSALFTAFPSQAGILTWGRSEFGELPAGPAADGWMRAVAEIYATRSLAGTPGYELTPGLQNAGGIAANEKNPAVLSDGLVRALRAALYLGTPDPGGVLDWARRQFGDLPPR